MSNPTCPTCERANATHSGITCPGCHGECESLTASGQCATCDALDAHVDKFGPMWKAEDR